MRRDDPEVVQVSGVEPLPVPARDVIRVLEPLVTLERMARFVAVAKSRVGSVVVVVDGLTDPHNTSAVLRSADAFGIGAVHVIPGKHGFRAAHRVAKGSERWLDVRRHPSAQACASVLRTDGFRILCATAGGRLKPADLPQLGKIAVVLGNEHFGVGAAMRELADDTYEIPMVGFVESLNVSVAAAITLHAATQGRHGDLGDDAREDLLARFLMASVRDAARVIRERAGR